MSKLKTVASLVLNSLIVLITTGVVISYFIVESDVIQNGWESFRFFTTDSNILAAAAALAVAVCDIRMLKGKRGSLPHTVEILKYVGTVSVLLTFCTVMFFLIPIYGVEMQLGGTGFHMHVGAPMMSLVSFCFLEKQSRLRLTEMLFGLLPTVIYGAVYFIEVVLISESNGGWADFYAFNQGGAWGVTIAVMLTATALISFLVALLHNLKIKKTE